MISQNSIQQVLSRIDVTEVVGTFVKLKKRGANYLGLCPFHNERTPSFTVSPAKEIYKCFGCGKSGNSISFLMEHEKLSYVEAIRWLANKYNVELEETAVSPEIAQQQQVSESLYIINTAAQKFYAEQLFDTEAGKDIGLPYLKERGFSEATMKKFGLGYAPDKRDAFASHAVRSQFNKDLLQKSGLVVERNEQLVDNYRDRIIFLNHFLSPNAVLSRIERLISPYTIHIGFKADLDLPAFLAQADLQPVSIEKVNVPRLWSLVTCVKD